jgi:formyltetrahydrofolate-dependent phosphoribosylglycinamide formyltransferase
VTGRRAAFLDRDGTLIEDPGFLSNADGVRLLPGAAESVARLNHAGVAALVVTNQSGIARGLLTVDQYAAIQRRLDELLARKGARLDAHYFCPHHPEITGPCDCRKPAVALYRRAATDLDLDLNASWWIGDRMRDVEPAGTLGGRGILVLTGAGAEESRASGARQFKIVADITAAVNEVLRDEWRVATRPSPLLLSPAMTMRVAVAVSGRGSNLEALLRALGPDAPARVVLVVSNRADAGGLARALEHGVPGELLRDAADANEWLELLRHHRVDLLVLAGYLKLVPAPVVARYRDRILNIHPALLPTFGGPGMYGLRVHQAVLASGARESGATVHLVNEVYDRGRILAQTRVPVLPGDTPDTLAARVLEAEHRLLPAVVLAAAAAGHPVPLSETVESSS